MKMVKKGGGVGHVRRGGGSFCFYFCLFYVLCIHIGKIAKVPSLIYKPLNLPIQAPNSYNLPNTLTFHNSHNF